MTTLQPFEKLEVEFAKWNDLDPLGMVVCSSGTAALHLALESLEIDERSSVAVPDFAMIACARACTLARLFPRFVECGPDLLMKPHRIQNFDGMSLRVIMPVHTYGRLCEMEEISSVAVGCDLLVVEDLAEAHGCQPHINTDAACWSFYKNKIICGEEGGAVWFDNIDHAKRARSLRCLGFTDARNFDHIPYGHNYRMSNVHASLILESLKDADSNLRLRETVAGWYDSAIPKDWKSPAREVNWVYDLRIDKKIDLDHIVKQLRDLNIPARSGFKSLSGQQEYVVKNTPRHTSGEGVMYFQITPETTREQVRDNVKHLIQLVSMNN